MSDFRKQVHDHYDAQSLPPEKVDAILAEGRDAAAGAEKTVPFPTRKRWPALASAVAAVVALIFAGTWWTHRDVGDVAYAAIPPRIIEFFKNEPHLLPPQQDKKVLRDWMVQNGAPKDSEIPASLLGLESAACQVVDVKGKNVLLSCYWRENIPGRGPHELIHLIIAKSDDFYDQPKSGKPVVTETEGWSFASWSKGDAIYTLATAAPKEKMLPYISAVLQSDRTKATAALAPRVSQLAVWQFPGFAR